MTLSGLASLVHHATLSRHAVLCDVVNTSCSSLFSSSLPSHPPRYYLGSQSFTSRLGGIAGECMLFLWVAYGSLSVHSVFLFYTHVLLANSPHVRSNSYLV